MNERIEFETYTNGQPNLEQDRVPDRSRRRANHTGRRRLRRLMALALSLALGLAGMARAAPGDLDPGFDGDGMATTTAGGVEAAHGVALQPDGKIVTAGESFNGADRDFALARYHPNGALDTTFDGDGIVTTAVGVGDDRIFALALQPDGKIVTAGESFNGIDRDFALARYHPNGALDTTFDGDGIVTTAVGVGDGLARALALQPDGKIVVGGYGMTVSNNRDFALARYHPNGALDTTFDGDGIVTTPVLRRGDEVRGVALQPDGKIVAAGLATIDPAISDYDAAVVRYHPNGALDTTFDGDGKLTNSIGPDYDEARSLALQPDGKIVAAGVAANGSDFDFALLRYHPNGTLDTGFDGDGVVTTAVGASHDVARSVALQPDGKIVAAGYAQLTNRDFAFVRYNPDGTPDTTFSGDAKMTVNLGGADVAWGIAFQPDGKIVAAGESLIRTGNRLALVRILGA